MKIDKRIRNRAVALVKEGKRGYSDLPTNPDRSDRFFDTKCSRIR